MSTVSKTRSTTTQKPSLQSLTPPESLGVGNDELHSPKDKLIQTRLKTKMNKMKGNTSLKGDLSRKTTAQYIDGDEAAKRCQVAGQEQKLRKRQRPAPEDKDNNNDAATMDTPMTIKKHKMRSHHDDRKQQHYTIITNSNNKIATSASTRGSPLEIISTTMDQQQTDLLSPMSPVPSATTSNYNCNKKEKVQLSVELVELGKKHDLQPSLVSDGDSLEYDRSASANYENDLGVAIPNIGDDSGGGDDDGNTNISSSACQHSQKTAVVNISQESESSIERQSDTQNACMTIHNRINKFTGTLINLNEEDNTMDGHTQPVGFLKRVASYIFG